MNVNDVEPLKLAAGVNVQFGIVVQFRVPADAGGDAVMA